MSSLSAIGQGVTSLKSLDHENLVDNLPAKNTLLDNADKALKALLATKVSETSGSNGSIPDSSAPTLTPPTAAAQKELGSTAMLTLLLGQLNGLLGDVTLSQLTERVATLTSRLNAQKQQGDEVSRELKTALAESETATGLLQTAMDALQASQESLAAINQKLAQAEARLSGMQPEDAEYDRALAEYESLKSESQKAKLAVGNAMQSAQDAQQQAKDQVLKLDKILTQLQGLDLRGNPLLQQTEQEALSAVARMSLLMATFLELLNKNNEESLQNDLETFKAMQEARQKELDKKSDEYQKEVEKAEKLNRVMGCIGKILGALLTIISVVAAVFTGGSSLVLAAVGLAIMAGDKIVKAATGVSFIQAVLNPLMENVLKPLMDLIGKAITDLLVSLGVDEKKAELAGSILGAVLAAVAMVVLIAVVAVVGKGALSKMGDLLNKLLSNTIKKIVPGVLKETVKSGTRLLSQGMTRLTNSLNHMASKIGLPNDAAGKALLNTTLRKASLGGEVTLSATQAGGNIAQGVMNKNASELLAGFTLALFGKEQIDRWLEQATETFGENQKVVQTLTKTLSDTLQQNADAGRFVLRQSRI